MSTLLLNRNKYIGEELFFVSLHFPQYLYWPMP